MSPTVVVVAGPAAGARPPVVSTRWMNVVAASLSPSSPGVVAVALSSNHGIAVGSTVTPSTRLADDRAAVLGLPSRAAVVRDDQLAVVAVEVGAGSDEPPAVAGRTGVAAVDLDADRVADEEDLVAVLDIDPLRHLGTRSARH